MSNGAHHLAQFLDGEIRVQSAGRGDLTVPISDVIQTLGFDTLLYGCTDAFGCGGTAFYECTETGTDCLSGATLTCMCGYHPVPLPPPDEHNTNPPV